MHLSNSKRFSAWLLFLSFFLSVCLFVLDKMVDNIGNRTKYSTQSFHRDARTRKHFSISSGWGEGGEGRVGEGGTKISMMCAKYVSEKLDITEAKNKNAYSS